MTKVLVTGAGGQLGTELQRQPWPAGTDLLALRSSQLDITASAKVATVVAEYAPDVIVNAAAYTAVDRAEEDSVAADEVNHRAVEVLAKAADKCRSLLVHISTDYVFDGLSLGCYLETDEPRPVNVYGATKLAGEAAAATAERSITLRTSWVFSATGHNFVKTVLHLGRGRSELGVVADQFGCPTSAADLANGIIRLIAVTGGGHDLPEQRLFHLASPDEASWHDLASETLARSTSGFAGEIKNLTTAEYPTAARRPGDTRLSSQLIADELNIRLPPWRTSLARVVAQIEEMP